MNTIAVIEQAVSKLDGPARELALDFSAVVRIDAPAIRALENLAGAAERKSVAISLRNVNIEVYKVLKLVKLTPRFSFQ